MTRAVIEGNCLLAAPPGLGKTASTLDAIDRMVFDTLEVSRTLYVAPKIVASDTVPNELRKWADFHRLTFRFWGAEELGYEVQAKEVAGVAVGKKLRPADKAAVREKVLSDKSRIHLISRDNFYAFVLCLGKDWPYDLLVLDESDAFGDLESSRSQAAKAVLPYTKRVVMLNGTPVGNKLERLWAQMCLVDGGESLGQTLTGFRLKWMEPDKKNPKEGRVYSWKPAEGALDAIVERCRGRLITMLETDWLDLPPMITKEIRVDIPRGPYEQMERDLLLPLEGDLEAVAVNSGVLYNKLAQIACGIVFDTEKGWHEIHRAKLDALAEVVEEHNGPLLIWTSFQPDLERIRKLLPRAQMATKVKDLERRWNAGEIDYLLAHPASLAWGANLQDCPGSGMCWFGITSNAVHWNQGVKRLHRGGRREPVLNYAIVARDTVEDVMLRSRADREAIERHVMEALAYRIGRING